MSVEVREAREEDLDGIRDLLMAAFEKRYPSGAMLDAGWLRRCLYSEREELFVATHGGSIAGFASLSTGARDLVGKLGRLVVHPDHRDRGIDGALMEHRLQRAEGRIHVGWTEARIVHPEAQQVAEEHGFRAVGFEPSKYDLGSDREAAVVYLRLFGEAADLRRGEPRVIPEVYPLATNALGQLDLPLDDPQVADDATGYPVGDPVGDGAGDGDLDVRELEERPFAQRFEVERARLRGGGAVVTGGPDVGYLGMPAVSATYLVAERDGAFVGAVGLLEDEVDRRVRILELLGADAEVKGELLQRAGTRAREAFGASYVEIDVSAYDPDMQRTLVHMGYVPVAYLPGLARSGLARLDVVRMAHAPHPGGQGGVGVGADGPADEALQLTPGAEAARAIVENALEDRKLSEAVVEVARSIEIFHGLGGEEFYKLARLCRIESFDAGKTLIHQGEDARHVFVLIDGGMQVVYREPDAADDAPARKIDDLRSGEIFGEMAMVEDMPRSASVISSVASKVVSIPKEPFERLLAREPHLGYVVMSNVARSLSAKLRRRSQQVDL